MSIEAWFDRFAKQVTRQVPRNDWPKVPEYWESIRRTLARSGPVTLEIAQEAIDRLLLEGFPFPSDLHKPLYEMIQRIYRERPAPGLAPESREAAAVASADCPNCGGQGLAVRFRHHPQPGQPRTVELHCVCPLGRWIRSKTSEDLRRRIPDLGAYTWLQVGPVPWSEQPDNRYCYPPDLWDGYADRPVASHLGRPTFEPLPQRESPQQSAALTGSPEAPRRREPAPNVTFGPGGQLVHYAYDLSGASRTEAAAEAEMDAEVPAAAAPAWDDELPF